jgi:GH24 family phage-related lysozyme (muramidase)
MSTWKVNNNFTPEVTINTQPLNTSSNFIDRAAEWLKAAEGFSNKAYKDGRYFSVGYGFNDPKYTKNTTMTLEEAEQELRRQLTTRAAKYQKQFGSKWDNLTDN